MKPSTKLGKTIDIACNRYNYYKKHKDNLRQNKSRQLNDMLYFPAQVPFSSTATDILNNSYNGFVVSIADLNMIIDPGVGFYQRLTSSNEVINSINTFFISHGHLDHLADFNVIADHLLRIRKSYTLYTTQEVIDKGEVSRFHSGTYAHSSRWEHNHSTSIINEDTNIGVSNCELSFCKLVHSAECYALKLKWESKSIVYVSDTGYATKVLNNGKTECVNGEEIKYVDEIIEKHQSIKDFCTNCDFLIVNIDNTFYNKNSKTHLTMYDIIDMCEGNNVKNVVLHHIRINNSQDQLWLESVKDFIEQRLKETRVMYPDKHGLKILLNKL